MSYHRITSNTVQDSQSHQPASSQGPTFRVNAIRSYQFLPPGQKTGRRKKNDFRYNPYPCPTSTDSPRPELGQNETILQFSPRPSPCRLDSAIALESKSTSPGSKENQFEIASFVPVSRASDGSQALQDALYSSRLNTLPSQMQTPITRYPEKALPVMTDCSAVSTHLPKSYLVRWEPPPPQPIPEPSERYQNQTPDPPPSFEDSWFAGIPPTAFLSQEEVILPNTFFPNSDDSMPLSIYANSLTHFENVPTSAYSQNLFSELPVESQINPVQTPEGINGPSLFSLSMESQNDPAQMPEQFHDMPPVDPVSDNILIALTKPFLMAWCTGDPPRLGFVPVITE